MALSQNDIKAIAKNMAKYLARELGHAALKAPGAIHKALRSHLHDNNTLVPDYDLKDYMKLVQKEKDGGELTKKEAKLKGRLVERNPGIETLANDILVISS